MAGRLDVGAMVQTPLPLQPGSAPGMLKLIVLESELAFAALIASRKLQPLPKPSGRQNPSLVSAVVLTTSVAGGASSLLIVSVVGFVPPIVAVSVGLDRLMVTVSFAS